MHSKCLHELSTGNKNNHRRGELQCYSSGTLMLLDQGRLMLALVLICGWSIHLFVSCVIWSFIQHGNANASAGRLSLQDPPNNLQNSFTLCRTRIICESVQQDNPRTSATFRCILIKFANSHLWISGPPSVSSVSHQSIRNITHYCMHRKEFANDTDCTWINILLLKYTIIILWQVLYESSCSCWPDGSDAQLTIKQPHQHKTMENGPSDLCPGQVWHDIHSTHLSIDLSSQSTTTNTWGMSFRFHRLKKLPINPNFTAATWSRHI